MLLCVTVWGERVLSTMGLGGLEGHLRKQVSPRRVQSHLENFLRRYIYNLLWTLIPTIDYKNDED